MRKEQKITKKAPKPVRLQKSSKWSISSYGFDMAPVW